MTFLSRMLESSTRNKSLRNPHMKSSEDRVKRRTRSDNIQSRMWRHLKAPRIFRTLFSAVVSFAIKNSLHAFSNKSMVCGDSVPGVRLGQ